MFLFGDAFFDGAVVDGTQAAHVGRDGVHGYAAGLEVGFVVGHHVGIDIFDVDVASASETTETVERGFVGFACAYLVETAQAVDGGLHEGVEAVARDGGEGGGEAVGREAIAVQGVDVGHAQEEGEVGMDVFVDVGEVAEARGAACGGDEDVGGVGKPFIGVEPVGGFEKADGVVVCYLKIEAAFIAVDR